MIVGIEATHALKAQRTGVEEACWQIIQNLKTAIPSTVRVILYVNSQPQLSQFQILQNLPTNWEIKELYWPFKKGWSQLRLAGELWRHPPDIFFAPGQLIPFYCPKDTVVCLHDSAFLAYPNVYGLLSRWYLSWMNNLIIKKARWIITSTEFNKIELNKYYGSDVLARVKVIPWAFNQKFCVAVPDFSLSQSLLQKYNLFQPYLMYVGRLEEKKNIKRLISAFNLLRQTDNGLFPSNHRLLLVGQPGVGYTAVKQVIDDSPYKSDIITPGWVDPADLPELLRDAAAFVFPSLYEGFGIPVLEAMASGTAVVTADIPALHEVGGEAVTYVNPLSSEDIARGISSILLDQSSRESQIASGLIRSQQFSWSRTAERIWQVLQDCQSRTNLV